MQAIKVLKLRYASPKRRAKLGQLSLDHVMVDDRFAG
jgi:hypothetical protein